MCNNLSNDVCHADLSNDLSNLRNDLSNQFQLRKVSRLKLCVYYCAVSKGWQAPPGLRQAGAMMIRD